MRVGRLRFAAPSSISAHVSRSSARGPYSFAASATSKRAKNSLESTALTFARTRGKKKIFSILRVIREEAVVMEAASALSRLTFSSPTAMADAGCDNAEVEATLCLRISRRSIDPIGFCYCKREAIRIRCRGQTEPFGLYCDSKASVMQYVFHVARVGLPAGSEGVMRVLPALRPHCLLDPPFPLLK